MDRLRTALLLSFLPFLLVCTGPSEPSVRDAAAVEVTPAVDTLDAIGETVALQARVLGVDRRAIDVPVEWVSSSPRVATVSSSGVVTGAGVGATTVRALAGNASGSAEIHVRQVPASVAVDPSVLTLPALGATARMQATVLDAKGHAVEGGNVTWEVSDTTVVTVSASGLVTARAPGSAAVAARMGSVSGAASVTVAQALASFELEPDSTVIVVGSAASLTANAVDSLGSAIEDVSPEWVSRNPAVVTVSEAGVLSGWTEGAAWVVASLEGQSDSTWVSVVQGLSTLEVLPATATLTALDDEIQFEILGRDALGNEVPGLSATWRSSSNLARLVAPGRFRAVAPGVARITATVGDIEAGASLTVSQTPVTLSLSPDTLTFTYLGETGAIQATMEDRNGHAITATGPNYAARSGGVVSVDSDGIVTAVGDGETWVVATGGAVRDSVAARVAQVVSTVRITGGDQALRVGATTTLEAEALDAGGSAVGSATIEWASRATAVASVSSAGEVTGVAEGTTWIVASVGSLADSVRVTVTAAGVEVVWEGDLHVTSVADADSVRAGGYTRVTGSLVLASCTLTSTAGLESIEIVEGSLSVRDCADLTSVSLPNTTTVGSVAFLSNPKLESISLPSLETASDVQILLSSVLDRVSVPALVTATSLLLSGPGTSDMTVDFGSLRTVTSELLLMDTQVSALSFPSLTAVGEIQAERNAFQTLGLPSLVSARQVMVTSCTNLTSFSAPIPSAHVSLALVPALASVSLPSLVSGGIGISGADVLTSVSLPVFTDGSVSLWNNPVLTQASFPVLTDATKIEVYNNPALATLELPALTTITGRLALVQTGLANTTPFSGVTSGLSELTIRENTRLGSVTGLNGLGDALSADPIISGSVQIKDNAPLSDSAANTLLGVLESKFSGTAVAGTVTVSGNG